MFPTNPPPITWTQVEPAYEVRPYEYALTDIRTIRSWFERENDLFEFRKLGDDWDGFGADTPNPTIIDKAVYFLRILRDRDISNPPRRIVLSSDGFVALEWVENNALIQAEVGDSNEIEWMVASPGQPTEFAVEKLAEPHGSGELEKQRWRPPATIVEEEPAFASEP